MMDKKTKFLLTISIFYYIFLLEILLGEIHQRQSHFYLQVNCNIEEFRGELRELILMVKIFIKVETDFPGI
jgi:hypothetical protein